MLDQVLSVVSRALHAFVRRILLSLAVCFVAAGCEDAPLTLSVALVSDFAPGPEFQLVRTELCDAETAAGERLLATQERRVEANDAFFEPHPIADFSLPRTGSFTVRTTLEREGVALATRTRRLFVRSSTVVTIEITRSCAAVVCPGDATHAETCVQGACVDTACGAEESGACPLALLCTDDDDCVIDSPCAQGRCQGGVCLAEPREEACDETEWCHPREGCAPVDVRLPPSDPPRLCGTICRIADEPCRYGYYACADGNDPSPACVPFLRRPVGAPCGDGLICNADAACVALPDASIPDMAVPSDASVPDLGALDDAMTADIDAETDADIDAADDAEIDAPVDAPDDSELDLAVDAALPTCAINEVLVGDACILRRYEVTAVKASNADEGDVFGTAVALSADGATFAIGAPFEANLGRAIDGDEEGNDGDEVGAVYVYRLVAGMWQKSAYLKASNADSGDRFGSALALSADGSTLVVGAPYESSAATTVNGDATNNATVAAGAVYVFRFAASTWSQEAYLKASNANVGDRFGTSVAVSADGTVAVVGAVGEDSSAVGVGGNRFSNTSGDSGAAYVFRRSGVAWTEEAYLKASNTGSSDGFGHSVAIAGDGLTIAVGAPGEDSADRGTLGAGADNDASESGATYVFAYVAAMWSQEAYVKASNTDAYDEFGYALALSENGDVLVVGAPGEASGARGVGSNESSNSSLEAGAAYWFARSGASWSQRHYLKASNTGAGDRFASALALSADASTLLAGALREASGERGLRAGGADNTAPLAGAVYVFVASDDEASQEFYVKASDSADGWFFGAGVTIDASGDLFVVGAPGDSGNGRGLGYPSTDATAPLSGAAYLFGAHGG